MDTTQVRLRSDRRSGDSRAQLLRRIRAEFMEMPCLRLTRGQAQRLFGIRQDICERVFTELIEEGTLTRGPDARYGLPIDVACRGFAHGLATERRTAKAS
jgi:hypothetical protein